MSYTVGIDIGGTNLRMALVSPRGQITSLKKIPVGNNREPHMFANFLVNQIIQLMGKKKIKAIGMGVPGIVSPKKGIVYSSPHFPQWRDFPITRSISKKIKRPVIIDNDAHMIARGEHIKGAAKNLKTFLMLTLGTGIGGAIMLEEKIVHGTRGFAGEFGHMVLEPEGQPCACGSRGCFETFVSATALFRMIRLALADDNLPGVNNLDQLATSDVAHMPSQLAELALAGNEAAKGIFEEMGYYLGMGLASLVNVTGIEKIVIGGGLIASHALFLPAARTELKKRTYAKTAEGIEIKIAKLGDKAGILGAGLKALGKILKPDGRP